MDLAALGIPSLAGDLERVEAELRSSLLSENPLLTEIASHLSSAGGKRIRPLLALCAGTGRGGGPAPADVITGAVAVELVHLGSLYHDDVIDEAATRRGVPSVNAKWGNREAILAGDYLLARASELAASLGTEVASVLASTIAALCEGQILELQQTYNTDRDEAAYFRSIEGKTAALTASACRIGAITGGLPKESVEALTLFGRHTGIVFQIVDDVLDLVAEDGQMGKPAGQDLVEGVYTLPVIYALRTSPELRGLLGHPGLDQATIEQGRSLVCANGAVDSAMAVAERHTDAAMAALESAGLDPAMTTGMRRLAQILIDRHRPQVPSA